MKILHENALFLRKISKPFPDASPYLSASYSKFLDSPLFATGTTLHSTKYAAITSLKINHFVCHIAHLSWFIIILRLSPFEFLVELLVQQDVQHLNMSTFCVLISCTFVVHFRIIVDVFVAQSSK